MVCPVFQVSGLQHVPQQPQEPVVVDLLRQYREHDRMVETPETVGEVTLNEPARPTPAVRHLPQRGMAAPVGAKPVRAL